MCVGLKTALKVLSVQLLIHAHTNLNGPTKPVYLPGHEREITHMHFE